MKWIIQAVSGHIPGAIVWRYERRDRAEHAARELAKQHNVTIEVCCVVSTVSNVTTLTRHDEQNENGE